MKTVKDITGLERPILKEYLEEQARTPEDGAFDAYTSNLGAYTSNLEQFILKEEKKKEGYMSLLYGDLKDLEHLNNRAIDLNNDMYLELENYSNGLCAEKCEQVCNMLMEQWYDALNHQEKIIMALQNLINMKRTGREEKKEDEL